MNYVDETLSDPEWLMSLESGTYSYTTQEQWRAETRERVERLKEKVEQ